MRYSIPRLTQRVITIGSKKRKIVICPPELRSYYYEIHLKLSQVFEDDPYSRYVHCRMGKSVISNAEPHIGYNYTLKMDLKNFFYNITSGQHGRFIPEQYRGRVFYQNRIPQGLPSSPSAANLAFLRTDRVIANFCNEHEIVYTRYCDDLSFSFNDYARFKQVKDFVHSAVKLGGMLVNTRKTRLLYAKAGRRIICGVGVGHDALHPTRKSKRNLRTYKKNGQDFAAQGMQAWINSCDQGSK